MELRRQIIVIRHWLWLVVLSVVLAGGAAYLVSSSWPKVYEGRATLIVGQSLISADVSSNEIMASQRLTQTFTQLVTTTPLLRDVVEQLGLSMRPEELRRSVAAQTPRESTLFTIVASHDNPQTAADIANALAERLIAASPAVQGQAGNLDFIGAQLTASQRQIESMQADLDGLLALDSRTAEQDRQVDQLQSRLLTARQTYAQLAGASSGAATNLLTVVDPAVPAAEPSSPRVLLNTLLAALFGLIVALGLAFLFEYLDDTIKSPDDVSEMADSPTLGLISQMKLAKSSPDHDRLITLVAPRSAVAEAYRTMRTNLEFASVDKSLSSLLVTSAVPGEGKTTTSANVAMAFAQAGRRVILLDADMRRPGIHRTFELPNSHGLTTLLRDSTADLSSLAHPTEEPNLRVITTGPLPPNPAELLGSQRMRDVLARLGAEADLVVVDTPPLHAVTDAAILAAVVDGTLLVIRAGRTKRGAVRQAREALRRVGANVLGVALNRITERSTADYYYRYYGEYYAADTTRQVPGVSTARSSESR